jgi:phospholipid/cholesterol/gamma-HCH transport system substrate-binding protein
MKNTLTFILLVGLISCSDSEYYKVQFENVDRLTEGDKVILKGLEVGQVKDLKIDDENKVLATIWVGRNVKVTKGSTFTIHSELLGIRYVEINLADEKELMNSDEIQKGITQLLPDTTDQLQLTAEERDSLVNYLLTPFIKSANKDTVINEER